MTLSIKVGNIFKTRVHGAVKTDSKIEAFCVKNIEAFKDIDLKQKLLKLFDAYGTKKEERTCAKSFADDLIRKYEMCSDKNIKEYVKQWLLEVDDKNIKKLAENAEDASLLLDAVNCAQGKYSTLFSPYTVVLDKKAIKNAYNWAEGRIAAYYLEYYDYNADKAYITHNLFSNMVALIKKDFSEKEISEYLWEKYYIPYLKNTYSNSSETINKMLDIKNKYGTMVYIDSNLPETNITLNYVKDEFKLWKTAGGDKVKFPNLLDLSENNTYFKENNTVLGYCDENIFIAIKRFQIQEALRHEMAHLNDLKPSEKLEPVKLTPFEIEEMTKAGLSKWQIKYAQSNADDKKAVFVEGDMSEYSKKMKSQMIAEGVPEAATKLPVHKDKLIYRKMYKKNYGTEATAKVIDIFKNKFYPSEFENLFSTFLLNDMNADEIKYFFRKKTNKKYKNFEEYLNASFILRLRGYCYKTVEFLNDVLFK